METSQRFLREHLATSLDGSAPTTPIVRFYPSSLSPPEVRAVLDTYDHVPTRDLVHVWTGSVATVDDLDRQPLAPRWRPFGGRDSS